MPRTPYTISWLSFLMITSVLLFAPLPARAQSVQILSESEVGAYARYGGRIGATIGEAELFHTNNSGNYACTTLSSFDSKSLLWESEIKAGDMACSVDNLYFESKGAFVRYLQSLRPGDTVVLGYVRPGESVLRDAVVSLISVDQLSVEGRTFPAGTTFPDNNGALGITFTSKTVGYKDNAGDPGEFTPVFMASINSVSENAPAHRSLKEGDVISSVNSNFFADETAFLGYIRSLEPGSIANIEYFDASGTSYSVAVGVGSAEPSGEQVAVAPVQWRAPQAEEPVAEQSFFESDTGKTVAVVGLAALVLAILSSDSGSGSSSNESAGGSNDDASEDYSRRTNYESVPSPQAPPVEPISPFYGDCHNPTVCP